MRIKRSRLKTYYLRSALKQKDEEGNSFIEYGSPQSFPLKLGLEGEKYRRRYMGSGFPISGICG